MKTLFKCFTIFAGIVVATMMSQAAFGESGSSPGQVETPEAAAQGAAGVEPSISATTLTWRSHQIGPGSSAGNLEGTSCPATYTMLSGSCHPGYNDRVTIINQFPNRATNTWRCGFKNNTTSTRTVWIYTLCGQ